MAARKRRAQVFYSGRVQGVGFRFTAREIADPLEVTGYVRNLPDGRVELVAEGEEEVVKNLLRAIGQSELGLVIQNEAVSWQAVTGEFERFTISF